MVKNFLNRKKFLNILENIEIIWDIIVIGGGATGLGTALDATSRGYKTILLEQSDFSKGTSSRSTKLLHGGIRYLSQGNIPLVYEALKERGYILKNAPHLVKKQKFIIPIFSWRMGFIYWIGLKIYEWLSGSLSFGKSKFLSKKETIKNFPELKNRKLKGGILYYDGKFDDSRMAINLAQTCAKNGGILLNYFRVNKLLKSKEKKISGVSVKDLESNKEYTLKSKIVINATGVFSDTILKMDDNNISNKSFIKPSQGTHIVLNKSFFSSKDAIVIPKTSDGRILFCIPWNDHVLVGTTETLLKKSTLDPKPMKKEVDFILETFNRYFSIKPKNEDILSAFSGLRPLFYPNSKIKKSDTKDISRSHKIIINPSGLINVIGGKWTTYRKMAEDTINKAIKIGDLPKKKSITKNLKIHGYDEKNIRNNKKKSFYWSRYGKDEYHIKELMKINPFFKKKLFSSDNKKSIYSNYTEAEVIWMIRNEMARTIEDVLARRFRLLFLNAKKAIDIAPKIAKIMAKELSKNEEWEKLQIKNFNKLAMQYHYSQFKKVQDQESFN